ncbi:hypothetical protein WJX72_000268 [[Myrmecia] bisecta]|uniref:VPS9 domain-containing protein n=1 Tax=[Myrmecia] bisecta TaxID=41462 RepID=A0AAW1P6L4_9CHLO
MLISPLRGPASPGPNSPHMSRISRHSMHSAPRHAAAQHARSFNESQAIVRRPHSTIARRVEAWIAELTEQLEPEVALFETRVHQRGDIALALESVLLHGMHAGLMESVRKDHACADRELHDFVARLQPEVRPAAGTRHALNAVFELSGVPPNLQGVDLRAAVGELRALDAATCPLDIIQSLEAADDAILHAMDALSDDEPGAHFMSADDLLPLFIAAIVLTQPRFLASTLAYVHAFHVAGDWCGQAGFQVATLEAAIVYLQEQASISQPCGQNPADTHQPEGIHAPDREASASSGAADNEAILLAMMDSDTPLTFAPDTSPPFRMPASPGQSRSPQSIARAAASKPAALGTPGGVDVGGVPGPTVLFDSIASSFAGVLIKLHAPSEISNIAGCSSAIGAAQRGEPGF